MASGCLRFCTSISLDCSTPSSSPFPSPIRNSAPKPFNLRFKGYQLPTNRLQSFSLKVTNLVADSTPVPNNLITEQESLREQPHPRANHEVPKSSEEQDLKEVDDLQMARVCDKLIDIFLVDKPTPADWRRLIVYSKSWNEVRPRFFERCQERADNDNNPDMKHKLLRLARKLREVDADVERHNELLQLIRSTPSQIGEVVAKRRKDFTQEFFTHLQMVIDSYHDNPTEQNEIAELGNTCLATVQAYDTATESIAALNAAETKFGDILNSPSLDAAYKKIDDLADKNQLDPALVLMMSKAWATTKETDISEHDAKDILYHLYMKARSNMERDLPPEVRILKYLLMVEDPEQLLSLLNDAFTPGEVVQGDKDLLYTEPETLLKYIKVVIDAYNFSREGTLIKEARDMMDPMVIQKLEELHELIQDKFM